jgi:zinc protease
MKISYVLALAVSVLAVSVCGQTSAPARSIGSAIIDSLTRGEVELTIPQVGVEVERVTLDNGMILYLYEDHRFPLFNVSAMIRCGGVYDPSEKVGLSGLVGTVMRTGGSKSVSGDSLNTLLEYIGGTLETGIGSESGSATLSVLSKDTDLGLRLLADVLRNPVFPQEKLDLARTDVRDQIRRRNDDPNRLVSLYFDRTIYGDHPYGRILEWASVKGITVEDMVAYHQRFIVPNSVMLAVSGDFNKSELMSRIQQYFGDWPRSLQSLPEIPAVTLTWQPGVVQVNKDISQAYIRIGELGIKRDNPDRFAIALMNYILGGGSFTSRLTSRVRSDEGLAYHVSSAFETGSRDYGTFSASCQTKSSTAHKAISIITEEIEKISVDGVTDQELRDAQNSLTNRLVFSFETASGIVSNLMSLEFDGYPSDYYQTYLANYRKVTTEDIKAVAQKYLKKDRLTFLVVGKPESFEKPLTDFGPVTNIEPPQPVLD